MPIEVKYVGGDLDWKTAAKNAGLIALRGFIAKFKFRDDDGGTEVPVRSKFGRFAMLFDVKSTVPSVDSPVKAFGSTAEIRFDDKLIMKIFLSGANSPAGMHVILLLDRSKFVRFLSPMKASLSSDAS